MEILGVNDKIDKLGRYFVYHNILERYHIGFEKFVIMVDDGSWEQFINERVG